MCEAPAAVAGGRRTLGGAGLRQHAARIGAVDAPVATSSVLVLFGQAMLIACRSPRPVGQIGVLAIQRTLSDGRAAGLATGIGGVLADAVYGAIGAFGVTSPSPGCSA